MRGGVLVFSVFLWLCSAGGLRAAERIPADVFARGSQMRAAALSPSGRYVAYVTHVDGEVNPAGDIGTIQTELILADLKTIISPTISVAVTTETASGASVKRVTCAAG